MGKFLLSCLIALVVSGCHPAWPLLPAYGDDDLLFQRRAESELSAVCQYFAEYRENIVPLEERGGMPVDLKKAIAHTGALAMHCEGLLVNYKGIRKQTDAVLFDRPHLLNRERKKLNMGIALCWINLTNIDGEFMRHRHKISDAKKNLPKGA